MIKPGKVVGKVDGQKMAVRVTRIKHQLTGDVWVCYTYPGRCFPHQAVFKMNEWETMTTDAFLRRITRWSIN